MANSKMNATYLCYTDGACKKSTGTPGGWGYYVKLPDGKTAEQSGWAVKTTIRTMELTAIAEALRILPDGAHATLFSDSRSALDDCARRLPIWRGNGWKNCDDGNAALLKTIDGFLTAKSLRIDWQWLRSHNGNKGNERADELAAEGARKAKASLMREVPPLPKS